MWREKYSAVTGFVIAVLGSWMYLSPIYGGSALAGLLPLVGILGIAVVIEYVVALNEWIGSYDPARWSEPTALSHLALACGFLVAIIAAPFVPIHPAWSFMILGIMIFIFSIIPLGD